MAVWMMKRAFETHVLYISMVSCVFKIGPNTQAWIWLSPALLHKCTVHTPGTAVPCSCERGSAICSDMWFSDIVRLRQKCVFGCTTFCWVKVYFYLLLAKALCWLDYVVACLIVVAQQNADDGSSIFSMWFTNRVLGDVVSSLECHMSQAED